MLQNCCLVPRNIRYSIDNWSLGCVIWELFKDGNTLFPGFTDDEVIKEILQTIGTPTDWPEIVNFPNYTSDSEIYLPSIKWPNDVIRGFLTINPQKRLTALDALNDQFFDGVRESVEDNLVAPKIYTAKCEEILLLREDPIVNIEQSRERLLALQRIYKLTGTLQLNKRTCYLAIHIMNKYVSLIHDFNPDQYHIIGLCSLSLANDYQELENHPILNFLGVTDDLKQALSLKDKIWQTLGYNLIFSLPYDFVLLYVQSISQAYTHQEKIYAILDKVITAEYNLNSSSKVSKASAHDLALSCLLAASKLSDEEEPQGCFVINNFHHVLADEILIVYFKI